MLTFSQDAIQEALDRQEQEATNPSGYTSEFLYQNKDMSFSKDGDPVTYAFKILVPPQVLNYYTHPVTQKRKGVMPYIKVSKLSSVLPDKEEVVNGKRFWKKFFSAISPRSSREAYHGVDTNPDPLLSFLKERLKDEEGFYGGPTESEAVVNFRQSLLSSKSLRDYNAPSKDSAWYQKKLKEMRELYPNSNKPEQIEQMVQRIRFITHVASENYWMVVQPVAVDPIEVGGSMYSEPLGPPKILVIDRVNLLQAFGMIYSKNFTTGETVYPYPNSLIAKATAWAQDPKKAKNDGAPTDLLQRLALTEDDPAEAQTYDLLMTVSKGAKRKYEFEFTYRRHDGKPLLTAIHPDTPIVWAEVPNIEEHLNSAIAQVQRAIDGYKVIFGDMSLGDYQALYNQGGSKEASAVVSKEVETDLPVGDGSEDDLIGDTFEDDENDALAGVDDDMLDPEEESMEESMEESDVDDLVYGEDEDPQLVEALSELNALGLSAPDRSDLDDDEYLLLVQSRIKKHKRGGTKTRSK